MDSKHRLDLSSFKNQSFLNEPKIEESSPFDCLPCEVILIIFSFLNVQDSARCKLVTRLWKYLSNDSSLKEPQKQNELQSLQRKGFIFLDKNIWEKCIGKIGEAPPLPKNIIELLYAPCPFWKKKKVWETHMLFLVPKSVNGLSHTINLFNDLIKSPLEGNPVKFRVYWNEINKSFGDEKIENTYWVLMTNDVMPNSRGLEWSKRNSTELFKEYKYPKAIECLSGICLHYINSKEKKFGHHPRSTYTRCSEVIGRNRIIVGALTDDGIFVTMKRDFSIISSREIGTAAVKKL